MDDMALYDVPAVIEHILSRTKCKSVSYIGYSQGSAIAFSALAQIEELNHKLNVMVAIAPAMKPKRKKERCWRETCRVTFLTQLYPIIPALKNKFISSLMHYSPHLLYPILGTGAFIPFAHTVQRRFPAFFKSCTEFSFNHIFGWDCRKFGGGEGAAGEERKRALYSHLFGHCSVRNVVHWFQIIGGEFSTYASSGEVKTDSSTSSSGGLFSWTPTQPSSTVRPKRLPTKHITTPLHLFHGSDDNISDAEYMREHLGGKNNTHFYSIEGYNHMDFLWAECAKERVWDDIIRILNQSNEKSEEVEGEDKTMVDKVESQENAAAADEIKEEDEESPHPSGLTKREMFFKSGNHLG